MQCGNSEKLCMCVVFVIRKCDSNNVNNTKEMERRLNLEGHHIYNQAHLDHFLSDQ